MAGNISTTAGDGVRIHGVAWEGTVCTVACNPSYEGANYTSLNTNWAGGANCNTTGTNFIGRIAILRRGTCTEEIRYIQSCQNGISGRQRIYVHTNWDTQPTTGDTVEMAYLLKDAATVTGLGLINKRVQDYTSTRKFRVGETGCSPVYSFFAFLDGASLESVDNSSTTCADIVFENNSHVINGYFSNGVGVGGGYIILTPANDSELGLKINNGARVEFNDQAFIPSVRNPSIRIQGACTTGYMSFKGLFTDSPLELSAPNVTYDKITVLGKANQASNTGIWFGNNVTLSNSTLIDINRIKATNNNTCNETFTLKNTVWANFKVSITCGPLDFINMDACNNNKHFILENPVFPQTYDSTLGCYMNIIGSCSDVTEQFTVKVNSLLPDGTKIQNTRVKITEICPTPSIIIQNSTNSCGFSDSSVIKRKWVGPCETLTTHSNFSLKTFDYGYTPFVQSQSISNVCGGFGQTTSVIQLTDQYICATEGCAVSDSTTKVTIVESTACNNHSLVKWTNGTGTLTSGDTIRQCATNLGIVHIIEGCSTAGTGVIVSRTSTNVANCSTLCTAGGWSATYTNSSELRFYWAYDAGAKCGTDRNGQQLYDHQIAKLGECTLDTADSWDDVVLWGRSEHAIPFRGASGAGTCAVKFETVRNVAQTRGWAVIGLASLGQISLFTSDNGTTFSPQATVTVTVNVNDENGNPIQGARVGVFTDPVSTGDTALISGNTNTCGVVTCSLTVAGDTDVIVRIRKKGYVPFETSGTISASTGLTVTATLITDTVVNLP